MNRSFLRSSGTSHVTRGKVRKVFVGVTQHNGLRQNRRWEDKLGWIGPNQSKHTSQSSRYWRPPYPIQAFCLRRRRGSVLFSRGDDCITPSCSLHLAFRIARQAKSRESIDTQLPFVMISCLCTTWASERKCCQPQIEKCRDSEQAG